MDYLTIAGPLIFIFGMLLGWIGKTLVGWVKGIEARMKKLEVDNSGRVRNPHLTNSAIEYALAISRDVVETRIYEDARINRMIQILRQIRTDPGKYNEDEPNGKDIGMGR